LFYEIVFVAVDPD